MNINITSPKNLVTEIRLGTSSPRLSGSVDISQFSSLTYFSGFANNITSFKGFEDCLNLSFLGLADNKLSGNIVTIFPNYFNNSVISFFNINSNRVSGSLSLSLSAMSNLQEFRVAFNPLSGTLPHISSNNKLKVVEANNCSFSGALPSLSSLSALNTFTVDTNPLIRGTIPSLNDCMQLASFNVSNCFQLSGTIPDLSKNTLLNTFRCFNCSLSGNIPSLNALTVLRDFRCFSNSLSGSIPSLSANTDLRIFLCSSNLLSGFNGGSISNTVSDFQANNNRLTQANVNAILASLVAANRTTGGVLNLGGSGNAAPTGQGLTDKATLISRGWTVTTN
jgi:hypothetical protein